MDNASVQRALNAKGFPPGPIDGAWGRRTIAAVKLFQASAHLKIDGIVGPKTLAALMPGSAADTAVVEALLRSPIWYVEAGRLMGTRETAGAKSSSVIMGWAKQLGGWVSGVYKEDATPWCGLFVAHCIGATLPEEVLPTNPLSALAWRTFGVPLATPRLGAVCVFSRKGGGHVGFYVGEDATAVHVRGGNQSDAVTETRVLKSRLVGYRWPSTAPLASAAGPIVKAATGQVSRNEA